MAIIDLDDLVEDNFDEYFGKLKSEKEQRIKFRNEIRDAIFKVLNNNKVNYKIHTGRTEKWSSRKESIDDFFDMLGKYVTRDELYKYITEKNYHTHRLELKHMTLFYYIAEKEGENKDDIDLAKNMFFKMSTISIDNLIKLYDI